MAERPAFSRSGETCLLGKCTAELPKVRIPEETLEILSAKAKRLGMSLVEYQRWKALIDAHGEETIRKMQDERIRVIAGKGEK